MASAVGELCGLAEPMGLSQDHKTVKMLIKINVTGSLPRLVLVKAQYDEAWVSVNYNVMPRRICQKQQEDWKIRKWLMRGTKSKGKLVEPEIISYTLKDGHSKGNLVICEGGNKVDLEEAIKRLDEAKEYKLKAGNLLDFSVKLVEPERKKRKYKRKAPVVDVIGKKSKVDQKSMLHNDDSNIILANPQMISIHVQHHDDPFDIFNDYVNEFPASPCLNQGAGISDEMILSAHNNNQITEENSEELGASVHQMV
ncbi:hypothetical protein C5167_001222 [Papaver somniferum]|uniref:Uncharacterized protein n=1 Tax=Papaver somniferum TaxID=3469 RepID=A0A4Y7KYP4_PAPSO|nr:hypothetical protein C5167_001222 [Papaver somniferum]